MKNVFLNKKLKIFNWGITDSTEIAIYMVELAIYLAEIAIYLVEIAIDSCCLFINRPRCRFSSLKITN